MDASAVDEFTREIAESEAPRSVAQSRAQIAKVRYTHEDCIDRILANPGISQNDLAAMYGYSASWICVVVNSDVFQARLAMRRDELVDPVLKASITERFKALTVRSLEVLQHKLSAHPDSVDSDLALEAAKLGAKSLGLGVAQVQIAPAGPDLNQLAERLRNFVRQSQPGVVDVQAREVPSAVPAYPLESRAAA